jgi:hypothetical protein
MAVVLEVPPEPPRRSDYLAGAVLWRVLDGARDIALPGSTLYLWDEARMVARGDGAILHDGSRAILIAVAATPQLATLRVDGSEEIVRVGGTVVHGGGTDEGIAVAPPGGAVTPIVLSLADDGTLLAAAHGTPAAVLPGATLVLGGSGNVIVYRNDGNDSDEDGVGDGLEAVLGTCAAACPGVFNPRDSDGDGLDDAWELFGTSMQSLPRWGADPLHKDLFIEVDLRDRYPQNPFSALYAEAVQGYFAVGPADHLANPDGRNGISVHMDIGQAPTNVAHRTLFGDWGGFDRIPLTADVAQYFRPEREGMFIHAILDTGGQAWGTPANRLGFSLAGGSIHDAVSTFVHELGHCLNLHHEGAADRAWGLNCNPIYPSQMSYAAWALGNPGFYDGALYGDFALNPVSLCERDGLGGGPVDHLVDYGLLGDAAGVDWNMDGTIQACDAPVRAAINWTAQGGGCDAHIQGEQVIASGRSPALVQLGDRPVLFYLQGQTIFGQRIGESEAALLGLAEDVDALVYADEILLATWMDGTIQVRAAVDLDAAWETLAVMEGARPEIAILQGRPVVLWDGGGRALDLGDVPSVDTDGAPPTLASGEGNDWLAYADPGHHLRIARFLDGAWLPEQPFEVVPAVRPMATRIGFAYEPLRDADGRDLGGGTFYLALTDGRDEAPPVPTLWVSDVVHGANSPLHFGKRRSGTMGHWWWGTKAVHGSISYAHGLQAAVHRHDDTLVYLPHADGIFDRTFRSGSDFEIMRTGLCLGVRNGDVAYCGP